MKKTPYCRSHIRLSLSAFFWLWIAVFLLCFNGVWIQAEATILEQGKEKEKDTDEAVAPSWQTVLPDSSFILPLFGTDNPWLLSSSDGVYQNIVASVPGDIITDLSNAGLVNDPYHDRNFLTQRSVWMGDDNSSTTRIISRNRTWVYAIEFDLPDDSSPSFPSSPNINGKRTPYIVIVEGIKMGASITINELQVDIIDTNILESRHNSKKRRNKNENTNKDNYGQKRNITDQFIRYIIPISEEVLERGQRRTLTLPRKITAKIPTSNSNKVNHTKENHRNHPRLLFRRHRMEVVFDPSIDTDGRFMACSGGWDWAPYSRTIEKIHHREGLPSSQRKTMTFGINKPIYIVKADSILITDVVPKIYYQGAYSLHPLTNGPEGDFLVRVEIMLNKNLMHLVANNSFDHYQKKDTKYSTEKMKSNATITYYYYLEARSNFSNETTNIDLGKEGGKVNTDDGNQLIVFNWTAPKDSISLWWPNGMGKHPLYTIETRIVTTTSSTMPNQNNTINTTTSTPWFQKRIGFRTIALVTTNETSTVNDNDEDGIGEGSGRHGMYFRVNGAVVYSRGANFVPMDQLEGRWSDEGHIFAVKSAALAGMNTIRVWGGGVIPPQSFYDACDSYGILIYQDLMFVEEGHHGATEIIGSRSYATARKIIRDEIVHVVKALSPHPSVVLFSGCNECNYANDTETVMKIYESFVMQTVADVDNSRPIWPWSPSTHGWETGVDTRTGRPNGNKLKIRRADTSAGSQQHILESHGPYQRGYSETYPGVNGHGPVWNSDETLIPPPRFHEFPKIGFSGIRYRNTFVSEFGASMFSSFESMSATLSSPAMWSVRGGLSGGGDGTAPIVSADSCVPYHGNTNQCNGTNVMAERNYPCDNRIALYFGAKSLGGVGPKAFQEQLYQCTMAQTLWMKGQIESMRSRNSFGILIWQLNENWPTGGWGALEYGPRRGIVGQIVGGRWKPLMYILRNLLFKDFLVACSEGGLCYARNDGCNGIETLHVEFNAWKLGTRSPLRSTNYTTSLSSGGDENSIAYFNLPIDFMQDADVVLIRAMTVVKEGHEDSYENGSFSSPLKTATSVGNSNATFSTITGTTLIDNAAFLWKVPASIDGLSLYDINISVRFRQGEAGNMFIELQSDVLALYVVLSTPTEGRFADNAFHLIPLEAKSVSFDPIHPNEVVDTNLLRRSLRIEHLGTYFSSPVSTTATAFSTEVLR